MTEEKKVAGFTKATLMKKSGETLTGIYEGYSRGGKFNSVAHYLILEKGGVQIKSQDEFLKASDGDKVGISGAKKLNEGLANVARGSKVAIKFDGWNEFTTKNGESAREALFEVTVLAAPQQGTEVASEDSAVADIL